MAKAQTPVANPGVTFTPEQLQQVIAQAIAEHEARKAQQAKADTSDKYTALTISAFKRKGFTDIRPRENVKTYRKWTEAGYIVKTGEKSIPVKGLRLFHETQVRPMTADDQKVLKEREDAKPAKTADKLPAVSPAAAPAPTVKVKTAKPVKVIIAPGKVEPLQ